MIRPSSKCKVVCRLLTVPCHDVDVFVFRGVFAHALDKKIDIRLDDTFLSSQGLVAESMGEVTSHSRMTCFICYENRIDAVDGL